MQQVDFGIVTSAVGMPSVKIGKISVFVTEVDGSMTSASPPSPPPSGDESPVVTIIIAVIAVLCAVLLMGFCVLARRARKKANSIAADGAEKGEQKNQAQVTCDAHGIVSISHDSTSASPTATSPTEPVAVTEGSADGEMLDVDANSCAEDLCASQISHRTRIRSSLVSAAGTVPAVGGWTHGVEEEGVSDVGLTEPMAAPLPSAASIAASQPSLYPSIPPGGGGQVPAIEELIADLDIAT